VKKQKKPGWFPVRAICRFFVPGIMSLRQPVLLVGFAPVLTDSSIRSANDRARFPARGVFAGGGVSWPQQLRFPPS